MKREDKEKRRKATIKANYKINYKLAKQSHYGK